MSLVYKVRADGFFKVFYENGVYIGDFVAGDDGFYNYWPELNGGYWSAEVMRTIANMLDEMNAPWAAEMEAYFNANA